MKKQFFILIVLLVFCQILIGQTNSTAANTEQISSDPAKVEHYEFLKEEIENYRSFIQQEREQHQEFIMWTIGIVVGIVLFFLGFLGIKTFEGLNKKRDELLEQLENTINKRIAKIDREFEEQVDQFEKTFQEKLTSIDSHFQDTESQFRKLLEIASQSLAVESGKFLLISEEKKLKEMEVVEIPALIRALKSIKRINSSQIVNVEVKDYDAIIYRSNTVKGGEDLFLANELLPILKEKYKKGRFIPVVVYSKDRSEFLDGETLKLLNEYPLNNLANNPTTLIDNTASAFRVAKLMQTKNS